jgi:putative ABC transport system permease protein
VVCPTNFSTLDLAIVAGGAFDARDRRGAVPVCIVNEAFARNFRGRSPIGQRIAIKPVDGPQQELPVVREIVGVARQVKQHPDEPRDFVQIYVPLTQDLSDDIILIARPGAGRADDLAPAVRAAISRVDKERLVSVRDIVSLEEVASRATSRQRFRAVMVMAFAALALAMAMVGMFGILTYAVQQQVRDFGVRRALGATTADVLKQVVASAVRTVTIGAAIGLVLSAAFGRTIGAMLFGVRPMDPATFAAVIVVVALTGAASVIGPAWRAARIDPARALRSK